MIRKVQAKLGGVIVLFTAFSTCAASEPKIELAAKIIRDNAAAPLISAVSFSDTESTPVFASIMTAEQADWMLNGLVRQGAEVILSSRTLCNPSETVGTEVESNFNRFSLQLAAVSRDGAIGVNVNFVTESPAGQRSRLHFQKELSIPSGSCAVFNIWDLDQPKEQRYTIIVTPQRKSAEELVSGQRETKTISGLIGPGDATYQSLVSSGWHLLGYGGEPAWGGGANRPELHTTLFGKKVPSVIPDR